MYYWMNFNNYDNLLEVYRMTEKNIYSPKTFQSVLLNNPERIWKVVNSIKPYDEVTIPRKELIEGEEELIKSIFVKLKK